MVKGNVQSAVAEKINGITYTMKQNPMGITRLKLTFNGDEGVFAYANEQGDKEISFSMGKNAEGFFNEYQGYADGSAN